ncbi:MAG: hypothetical protein IKR94_03650 [Bacteroidales bacterium]|nr:hypothetical protein [Bacteroidales bacterium]
MRNTKIAVALALTALTVFAAISCNSLSHFGRLTQGRIVYGIEYPKEEGQPILVTLLPPTMELKFKENNTVINITGFANMFNLKYITDSHTHTNYTLFRVMNQKLMYKADTTEKAFGYDQMNNLTLTYTDDTLTICGYKCHKAIAKGNEPDSESYDLYYTDEIAINRPNTNNPFKQLDGVLLGFQVRLHGISMIMRAIEIKSEEVDDSEFIIPTDFKQVTYSELQDFINDYMK